MVVAIGLWSIALQPGESVEVVPPLDLRVSNAALDAELTDAKSRSSVRLIYLGPKASNGDDSDSDSEDDNSDNIEEPVGTILCSLTPGLIEQAVLNLTLEGEQAVAFENLGKNVVFLSGNYIDQLPHDDPPDEDELGFPETEDILRMEDVSSDDQGEDVELEVPVIDDDVKMAELPSPPAKQSKKRPRDSQAGELDTAKPSKAESKKLKRLEAAEDEVVPPRLVSEGQEKEDEEAENRKAEAKQKKPEKKEKKKKEKEVSEDASRTTLSEQEVAGGVKVKDIKTGSGPAAKKGDTVFMRYSGKLEDGKVFDSNTKGKPFSFTLGDGDVIKGWDVGIVGMQAGGERQLTIPPSMGYGKRKQSGIPPSSILIFDVRLIKIEA